MSQTYQPSSIKRKRNHGFRKRKASSTGSAVLKRRMNKGRKKLTTV